MEPAYLKYLQKRYKSEIWKFLTSGNRKLIYGKGAQAALVYQACQAIHIHIEAFISTGEAVFPQSQENEGNYTIDHLPQTYADCDILIAMHPKWNKEIADALSQKGFRHVYMVHDWEPLNRLFGTRMFRYMMAKACPKAGHRPKAYEGGIIRFCEGFVKNISIEDYTRQELLDKICEEGLENALIQVYDKDNDWQGSITFSDLLVCGEEWRSCLFREKIRFDESVFDRCNAFFAKYPWRIFVPVYGRGGVIAYMAWLEEPKPRVPFNSQMYTIQNLKNLKAEYVKLFFAGVQEVVLHEANEMSYDIYTILKEKQIPYFIEGEQWKFLGGQVYQEEMLKTARNKWKLKGTKLKENERLVVYAQGTETQQFSKESEIYYDRPKVFMNYEWLNTYSKEVCVRIADKTAQKLTSHGIAASIVTFPEFHHLQKVTDDELYDSCHDIDLPMLSSDIKIWSTRYEKIYQLETIKKYLAGTQTENRYYKNRHGLMEWSAVEGGRRNQIYIIGPCVVAQTGLPTEHTIVSHLQKQMDAVCPEQYKVCGISVDLNKHFQLIDQIVSSIDFWDGDICLFLLYKAAYHSRYEVPLARLYDTRLCLYNNSRDSVSPVSERTMPDQTRWFSNNPIHINETGSKKVSEYIFDQCIKNKRKENKDQIVLYASRLDAEEQKGIDAYVKNYEGCKKEGTCGCIVMNCNPYTCGHDYLIDTARKQVDWLYVFVVEEDKSYFPFEDRYELVRQNTKKYANVIVLPSGNMILSAQTLPAYFVKEMHQEMAIDAAEDLRLFGLGIAPAFGITKRFAGQEPMDQVTEQYNRQMETKLPEYGITFVEIPRKQINGSIVSASKVRECMRNHDLEAVREYVPDCTWNYLISYQSKSIQ